MDVELQINRWISKSIEKNIVEFIEAAKTISRWKEYILNSFIDERYSNGYTEGTNNKIKVIKRIAFGYKSFELFRGRILYIFNGKLSGSIKYKNNSKVKNKKKSMIKILTLKILLFSLYYTNLCNFYFILDFIEHFFCL